MQKEKLIKRTTREHYEKYKEMKEKMGITFKDSNIFGPREVLIDEFKSDEHLNGIPLRHFDAYYSLYGQHARRAGYLYYSLAENTSLIKHCLIYEVIGAIPQFTDEEEESDA